MESAYVAPGSPKSSPILIGSPNRGGLAPLPKIAFVPPRKVGATSALTETISSWKCHITKVITIFFMLSINHGIGISPAFFDISLAKASGDPLKLPFLVLSFAFIVVVLQRQNSHIYEFDSRVSTLSVFQKSVSILTTSISSQKFLTQFSILAVSLLANVYSEVSTVYTTRLGALWILVQIVNSILSFSPLVTPLVASFLEGWVLSIDLNLLLTSCLLQSPYRNWMSGLETFE